MFSLSCIEDTPFEFKEEGLINKCLDIVGVIIVVIGRDQRVLLVNKKGLEILGYPEDEIIGKNWFDFVPGRIREKVRETFDRLIAGEIEPVEYFENPVLNRNGEERTIAWHNTIIRDKQGNIRATLSSGEDVTDKLEAERTLRKSEEQFRTMLESVGDHMFMMDRDLNIVWANERARSDFGEDVIGKKCYAVCGGRSEPCDPCPCLMSTAFQHGEVRHHDFHVMDKDGNKRYFSSTAKVAMYDSDGMPSAIIVTSRDITEVKQKEDALRRQARYDTLTNLPNRKYFMEGLQKALAIAKRYEDRRFAVVYLDLDKFKHVNDSLGHKAGDELLVLAAQRLQNCMRSSDTVARLGGDEFSILLEDIRGVHCITSVVERIQGELSAPFVLEGNEVFSTASMGVVFVDDKYEAPEDILNDADRAMYQAKATGGNCFRIFDSEMYNRALELMWLESDLRRALDETEFQLLYQPIVSLKTGKTVAAEAFLRWRHQQRGLVPPEEFIPLADETGLIVPIGEWVLKTACAQLRQWQMGGLNGLRVSVHCSARQFERGDLKGYIQELLGRTGVPAGSLELEMTERAMMSAAGFKPVALLVLSDMGVGISLDDFGTGYAALSNLKDLPIKNLKLDRDFIKDMASSTESAELVKAIIIMAHALKLNVVAEGVESREQLELLMSFGCDEAQGSLFNEAVPPDEFERFAQSDRVLI